MNAVLPGTTMGRTQIYPLLITTLCTIALTFCSCGDDAVQPPPEKPPVHTQQDTTSHDVTWEVFRLGRPGIDGSIIRDIYALNDTDVWAVGKFVIDAETDSLGFTPKNWNAAHWDGREWTLHNINEERYSMSSPGRGVRKFTKLYAVWVFGHNDLVAINGTDKVIWYDGEKCRNDINLARKGSVNKMWARSKDDFYYCGGHGTFGRYYNGGYHQINSYTDVTLNDVYGNNNEQVWTGGYVFSTDSRAFLRVDHGSVSPISVPDYFGGPPVANSIYICEDTLYAFVENAVLVQSIKDSSHRRYTAGLEMWEDYGSIESMRGTGHNNIFAAGHFATILHYNGKSWVKLQIPEMNRDPIFRAVSVTNNIVYIGGLDTRTKEAIICRGVLQEP